MKSTIVFIAFVTLVVVNGDDAADKERQDFLKKIVEDCSKEVGLEVEEANQLLLGDFSVSSREAKCFVSCFFKKEGFISEDGKPNREFIIDFMDGSVPVKRHELQKIVTKCTDFKSNDVCVNSFNLLRCFTKSAGEVEL